MIDNQDISTMMAQTQPCPFCGNKEVILSLQTSEEYPNGIFRIVCDNCSTNGPIMATARNAIFAWNHRKNY